MAAESKTDSHLIPDSLVPSGLAYSLWLRINDIVQIVLFLPDSVTVWNFVLKNFVFKEMINNRPRVGGAVLQTPLYIIH